MGTPNNLTLAIRSGAQPPGGLAGSYIHDFSAAVLNEAGDVAVLAGVFGSGTNSSNDRGIYVVRDGELDQVARKGQVAPGAGAGVYGAVGLPVMNKWGDVAFTGVVSGVGSGVWKEKNGIVEAVVLSTDDAPGGMPGERLTSFDEPLFNDLGQVAFLAGTNLGRTGIWAEDIDGVLRKLVVEGDTVEYRPGEFGTAGNIGFDSIIGFSGSQDGWASSFNAKGQLAFEAAIDGRNGVFVSSLVAVPEPASATLGALLFSPAHAASVGGINRENAR